MATLVAAPLALAAAHALARGRFRGRRALDAAIHLPLVLPPVVTGYALLLLFAPSAPLGAALDALGLPLALPLDGRRARGRGDGLSAHGPPDAAGAGGRGTRDWRRRRRPWAPRNCRSGRRVTVPLTLPGILAGVTLGFAKAFGEFGATITFAASIPGETRTLPAAIYAFLQVPGADGTVRGLVAVAVDRLAGSGSSCRTWSPAACRGASAGRS